MSGGHITRNVRDIKERIAVSAIAAGRRPEDIFLVAATKTQPAAAVSEAIAAGVYASGENRVQEFCEKSALGAYSGAPVHFIGHLQKNKLKLIVGQVDLIESVDSMALLSLISRRALELGICQDALLEVNIANEDSKSGFNPAEISGILEELPKHSGIRVRGLMAIPPVALNPGDNFAYFASMYKLFVDNMTKKYDNVSMDFLSMGMSGDFEDAIARGANMVRVGSAIFGPRQPLR